MNIHKSQYTRAIADETLEDSLTILPHYQFPREY